MQTLPRVSPCCPFNDATGLLRAFDNTVIIYSTYQALVDDVLDHRLNRVVVEMEAKNGLGKKSKTYDVDAENVSEGFFFAEHWTLCTGTQGFAARLGCRLGAPLNDDCPATLASVTR